MALTLCGGKIPEGDRKAPVATIYTWTRRLDFAFANFQRVERGETALAVVGG